MNRYEIERAYGSDESLRADEARRFPDYASNAFAADIDYDAAVEMRTLKRERKEMTQALVTQISVESMEKMARALASSGLFGVKDATQALALMLVAQAEGKHPALIARDYDIIQGRPAKKSEAMLRDFYEAGGKVEWHQLDDTCAHATFSHPQGGSMAIKWNIEMAKNIKTWSKEKGREISLIEKDSWRNYPRAMLRSRCVSEGIKTVFPGATSGMYVPEEVIDFEPVKNVTPAPIEPTPSKDPILPAAIVESANTDSAKALLRALISDIANIENKTEDTVAAQLFSSDKMTFDKIDKLHTEAQLKKLTEAIKLAQNRLDGLAQRGSSDSSDPVM